MELTIEERKFLQDNISLIDNFQIDELYIRASRAGKVIRTITEILHEIGIDPLEHFKETVIPNSYAYYSSIFTKLKIPDRFTTIGYSSFSRCHNLKEISLPENLKIIGDSAFGASFMLESIEFPNRLQEIGLCAFSYCIKLKEVTIPDSVIRLGSGAFSCCTALQSVKIGDGVTVLQDALFFNDENLTDVTIPTSVTRIEENAFTSVGHLNINYLGTKKQWQAIEKQKNWNQKSLGYVIHCSDGEIVRKKNNKTGI